MGQYKDQAIITMEKYRQTAATSTDEGAAKSPELFPMWDGGGVAYAVGSRVRFGGLLYKCLTAHTSQADWQPGAAVSLWVRIDDPAIEYPDWRQPQGAHDAYPKGAKVTHNEKRWMSGIDANVWEPGVHGWNEQI